jgi:cellulose synthase/poly-beta-1,6-N-acetylglucosamine synthase-like glycosyltransferase
MLLSQAFGSILVPNVCVLIDVGTQPGPHSIYHLWKSSSSPTHLLHTREIDADFQSPHRSRFRPQLGSGRRVRRDRRAQGPVLVDAVQESARRGAEL